MPGSNPLFGLNTLGGALSVADQGRRDASRHVRAGARRARHGRAQVEFESGGKNERGLVVVRRRQPRFTTTAGATIRASRLGQAFGKLGWRSRATRLSLTASGASTALHGNGLQDGQLARRALRERLHAARRNAQPLRAPQPRGVARARRRLERRRPGLPAPHRHAHRQRRPQRRLARPAALQP